MVRFVEEKKLTVIYKATNHLNGSAYVGVDSAWPKRKEQHLKAAFNPVSQSYSYVFHKALRKYGSENFSWDVVYSSKDHQHTLNVMESRFIQECNSHYIYGNGYNMTLGGDGGATKGMTGKHHNDESKRLIAKKKLGKKNGPRSQDIRKRIGDKLRGKKTGPQNPECVAARAKKLRGRKLSPWVVAARVGRKRGPYNV